MPAARCANGAVSRELPQPNRSPPTSTEYPPATTAPGSITWPRSPTRQYCASRSSKK
jgi:hypothetical protein